MSIFPTCVNKKNGIWGGGSLCVCFLDRCRQVRVRMITTHSTRSQVWIFHTPIYGGEVNIYDPEARGSDPLRVGRVPINYFVASKKRRECQVPEFPRYNILNLKNKIK